MTPPDRKPKSNARAGSRVSVGLVALGSATVVAIYGAGFYKTKAAADRLAGPPMPGNPRGPIGIPGGSGGPGRSMTGMSGGVPDVPTAGRAEASASSAAGAPVAAPSVTLAIPTVPRTTDPTAVPANVPPAGALLAPPAVAATSTSNDVTAPAAAPLASPNTSASTTASQPASTSAATTAPVPAASPAPASSSAAASAVPAALIAPAPKFKDGTYTGWGTCRHGDIQARIEITGGRIVTSEIAQCLTRYSCSWISPLPPQVLTRQSENVDYVSGATDSAIAFYWAVFDALSKAK